MFLAVLLGIVASVDDKVQSASEIRATAPNSFYPNQSQPLKPSPVQKLPVGAIRAKGWLLTQLELQRDGFSGHLTEISRFLDSSNSAWMGNQKVEKAGWEELPYWLRGQVALGYVLDDKKIIEQSKGWIEGALASQKDDGYFGPELNRTTKHGTPDLWPNMLMQKVFQTYFEATGDKRVLRVMSRYVDWMSSLPDSSLIDPKHYWHVYRVADQLESLIWLYKRTKEDKILKLADRLHAVSGKWVDGIPNYHGVNFGQGFREPAAYSVFSNKDSDWQASVNDLNLYRDEFGQMPGGMYGADENARKGFTDPRQAAESCAVAEMMYSGELLLEMSGAISWADDAENVAFNWLPVTMTPDLKALRYLQSGNMSISDRASKSPGIENGGPMFAMDPYDHRCCQHNMSMAWPFFTERLWTATNGNGLLAAMYAPSEVTAKVGKGVEVTITEETDYPFDDVVTLKISPKQAVAFPLSLRIPGWCKRASIELNGKRLSLAPKPGEIVLIERTWKSGDVVKVTFPMEVETKTWSQRPGTLSVYRGPLAYSLKIDEKYERFGGTDKWPAYEILPQSAWNYGLVPNTEFKAKTSKLKKGVQPFSLENVPVTLTAKARKIPEWTTDMYGLVAVLQDSPARSVEKVEDITLVPMGAARLRITVFPTATESGAKWTKPKQAQKPIPATYSHRNWWDSESALSDGLLPDGDNLDSVPRFTWWDHKGTSEWVQYNFGATRTFQATRVWWFDDSKVNGGCRKPASWRIEVKVGEEWTQVEEIDRTIGETGNPDIVTFKPVGGKQVRLVAQLQEGFSAGILEWEVD